MASGTKLLPGFAKRGNHIPESGCNTWYRFPLVCWRRRARSASSRKNTPGGGARLALGAVNRRRPRRQTVPLTESLAVGRDDRRQQRAARRECHEALNYYRHASPQDFESHTHHC